MQQFTLDEEGAAEYLAREIAQYDLWTDGDSAGDSGELEVASSYDPQDDDGGHDTASILYYARVNGYLTGPGSIEFEYVNDGDIGYCWLMYLDGPGSLKLSTYYSKIKFLGSGEARNGAEHALGILREAVGAANELIADLDRYYASRS